MTITLSSSLLLNYHHITTIDSSNHSSPTRDLLPSSTPSESGLEIPTILNRTPQTTPLSLTQRVITDSSLIPATRSRSELEQGSSADLLFSSISLGIVFTAFLQLVIYLNHLSFLSRTRQTPNTLELGSDNELAARAPILLLNTTPEINPVHPAIR